MCRWAAYIGEPTFLENIVTAPCHSLIAQSHHAMEAKTATNGDGFGVAWYGARPEPGLYRDILPAWSDPNLKSLCRQIESRLFLAHVRASTGGATSRLNCHPFVAGRWSFMHNGQIGGFDRLRRRLESRISDRWYDRLEGGTDSEMLFMLMLDAGLETDPASAVAAAAKQVIDAARDVGVDPHLRLTAAFTDGDRLYAVRYATDEYAPTLYIGETRNQRGYCLVSEPFDKDGCDWRAVPPGCLVTCSGTSVRLEPFGPLPSKSVCPDRPKKVAGQSPPLSVACVRP